MSDQITDAIYDDEPTLYDADDRQRCPSCDADISGLPTGEVDDCGHYLQMYQSCPSCGAVLAWQYYLTDCAVTKVRRRFVVSWQWSEDGPWCTNLAIAKDKQAVFQRYADKYGTQKVVVHDAAAWEWDECESKGVPVVMV